MRTDLPRLIEVLHAQEPPQVIWQQPFDYDPSHYKRLCNLNGAAPSGRDLSEYADDMLYGQSPLQPDLLRYLLPICLKIWYEDLLANERSWYSGFVEQFWAALAAPKVLGHLNPTEYAEVETFMSDALLDRIDKESGLSFSGSRSSAYTWFYALSSFCVVFPSLPRLWESWWEMTTPGQACASLQYLSCLLYEKDRNPIFSPWTRKEGGGPPVLWETEMEVYEQVWRVENIAYLQGTLTPAFVEDRLRHAARVVKGVVQSSVPDQMVADFPAQRALLKKRLAELPALLLASPMEIVDWSV